MAPNTQTRITAKTRIKEMPCRECGKPMQVGSNTRNAPRHFECGLKIAIDAQRQMHDRSGPIFDRWLAGCLNAAGKNPQTSPGPSK